MHGAGNDYIYIDCLEQEIPVSAAELSKKLSDRHFGVGSDGLVLILPSEKADFRMLMYNADGSLGAMCGNALRCIGKFVYDRGRTSSTELSIETSSGLRFIELTAQNGVVQSIRVDMGEPIFEPSQVPVTLTYDQVVQVPVEFAGESLQLTALSMGNPHAVFFVPEITDRHIFSLGPVIEKHEFFPDRTNVEFVKILNKNRAQMRVWERGSGETMACGSGACAVAVAGSIAGLLESESHIELPGGTLHIEWNDDNHVYMSGEAAFTFEGKVDLQNFF